MNDDDAPDFDYMALEVEEARAKVGRAIAEYLAIIRPNEKPYLVAWTAAAEWTNTNLEQTGRAGRDTLSPQEQTISATVGLGQYIVTRYA